MSDVPFDQLPPEVQEEILNGPAVPVPSGYEFDPYQEPNNLTPRIVVSVAIAISTIVFFSRVYHVLIHVKKPHVSDYLMVPTFCLFIAFCGVTYAEIEHGFFIHIWNFRARNLPSLIYLYLNSISLYAVSLMMIKVVIILEWLRIFVPPGVRNYFFWCGHGLLWLNVLFYVAAVLAINFSCTPRERYWYRTLPGTCIDTRPLEITSALVNFIVDVGILLLPQRVIWTLNMRSKRKFGISAIFSLGIMAVVTAGYRAAFTIEKSESGDLTYDYSLVSLLLVAEITLGIVIFCLPVVPKALSGSSLPALYKRLLTISRLSSSSRSNKASEGPGASTWTRHGSGPGHSGATPNNGSFVPLDDMTENGSQTRLHEYEFSQNSVGRDGQQHWDHDGKSTKSVHHQRESV